MRMGMYFMQEEVLSGAEYHRQGLKSLGLQRWHQKRCLQAWVLQGRSKEHPPITNALCSPWNLKDTEVPGGRSGQDHFRSGCVNLGAVLNE